MDGDKSLAPHIRSTVETNSAVLPLAPAERALMDPRGGVNPKSADRRCPNCQATYLPGALVCLDCGILFSAGGKTKKIGDAKDPTAPKVAPVGAAFVEEQRPIVLDINGIHVTLPVGESVIVGRMSEVPGDLRPDINLNAFDATELGVSRLHVKITRVRDLTHVLDLNSSNGTYLNGRRLVPSCPRILRNGDELQLGRLKAKVRL
jgi:FHA domain